VSAGGHTTDAQASPVQALAGSPSRPDRAGLIFRQMTVLPALLATAWLLAGLPLLLAGKFTALLMLVVSLPLAAIIVTFGIRWIPASSQGLLAARGSAPARTPWWALAGLVVVAVAFGLDQFRYHSQQIIVQRDPASYLQFGSWLARHGSLPIPVHAAAFGGSSHLLSFASPAFYQVGHSVVPQFMAGEPMTLAASFWIGGVSVAAATNVLIGGCGVLAFGGLVGRLVGPRWAPLGALILAVSMPEQFTARSTYSEPLAQVLFLGGLCLVIDSFSADGATRRKLAALAGIALGLTLLVRIDGGSDLLPLIPYCGLLVLGRRPQAWPLIGGTVLGSLYGAIDGIVLSRPYLAEIKSSLLPLAALGAVALAITIAAVLILWRRGMPTLRTDWLPNAAAVLAFVVLAGLVLRPYVQTVSGKATHSARAAMAAFERADHLPVQPDRLFYEISLHWVYWYLGVPIVILATIGTAVLARRCLRGGAEAWTLPLLAFAWIIVTVLLRPSITPDQPWASRRLVPGVLPGFILLALWASSWLLAWLRQRRGTGQVLRAVAAVILAAAMVLPAVKETFGIAHKGGGPLGARIVAVGLADKVTFKGEIGAVRRMCAAIPAHSSVLFVGGKAGQQMTQVVRGMCGEPAATVVRPGPKRVAELVAAIQRAGRTPVLLASAQQQLAPYGGTPRHIVALHSRTDTHTLVTPPLGTIKLTINIWMSEFPQ
jgi:hypothetical protein